MARLISQKLDEIVQAGDTICMTNSNPYLVLFAPMFHPEITEDRPYFIQEGTGDSCAGKKTIPKFP